MDASCLFKAHCVAYSSTERPPYNSLYIESCCQSILKYFLCVCIPQYPRIDTQALDHLIKSIMSVSILGLISSSLAKFIANWIPSPTISETRSAWLNEFLRPFSWHLSGRWRGYSLCGASKLMCLFRRRRSWLRLCEFPKNQKSLETTYKCRTNCGRNWTLGELRMPMPYKEWSLCHIHISQLCF